MSVKNNVLDCVIDSICDDDGTNGERSALAQARDLQDKVAHVGFDWDDPILVLNKIREELDEVEEEIKRGDRVALIEEMGDLLFAIVNLTRHLKIDPEDALRRGSDKFERRFRALEQELHRTGSSPAMASLEEMEHVWRLIKTR